MQSSHNDESPLLDLAKQQAGMKPAPEKKTEAEFRRDLRDGAKPGCDKCYGRGHTGRNVDTGIFQTCRCWSEERMKLTRKAENVKPDGTDG